MADQRDNDSDLLIDEEARKRFENDWNARKLAEIESYLPARDDKRYWATLEELLYIDLEFSWKEFEQLPVDETVSVHRSPTTRLQTVSRRLALDENRDLLQRLWDFEESLKVKSKKRKRAEAQAPGNEGSPQWGASTHVSPLDEADTRIPNSDGGRLEPTRADKLLGRSGATGQKFGPYELIETLGRGGMGVVFKAHDQRTGRFVALKMIRSNIVNRVDDETRRVVLDRFEKEARAVANIEHPNIVTLFEIGEIDDTPFLAMQLVEGDDLASLIRQSVMDGKRAARYLLAVARAIGKAHENGIIHRDLKPHNVLLDQHSDTPLLTDFGLAKLADDKDGLTETGELLGTPGYMSPEQAQGKPVGHGTDIYSLGATLYCLIGGRAPFQAADTMKTIEQIVSHPPLAPVEINPDVDADLNTICLKCLEKDPDRRYQSANALADDLQRYLKGEPIKARPISLAEGCVRWCRRNPLPTTIGVALVLLVLLTGTGLWRINSLWNRAEFYSQKNQGNADLAFESNRRELFLVAEDRSLKLPGMRPTKESLLLPLRDFFEEFIEFNGDYPQARTEFAFAHFALGKIAYEFQDYPKAIDHLTKAIELQDVVLHEQNASERAQMDLSNSLNLRGECYLEMGGNQSSWQDYERALELRQKLVNRTPDNLEYRRKLANVQMNQGNWLAYQDGKDADTRALEKYKESNVSRELYLKKAVDDSIRFNTRYDWAKCHFNQALSFLNLDREADALNSATESMIEFSRLHELKPNDLFVARDFARAAQLRAELGEEKERSKYLEQIGEAYLHITMLYPEEKQYYWLAAESLLALGDHELRQKDTSGADSSKVKSDFALAKKPLESAWSLVHEEQAETTTQKTLKIEIGLGLIAIYLKESKNSLAKERLDAIRALIGRLENIGEKELKWYQDESAKFEKILNSLGSDGA